MVLDGLIRGSETTLQGYVGPLSTVPVNPLRLRRYRPVNPKWNLWFVNRVLLSPAWTSQRHGSICWDQSSFYFAGIGYWWFVVDDNLCLSIMVYGNHIWGQDSLDQTVNFCGRQTWFQLIIIRLGLSDSLTPGTLASRASIRVYVIMICTKDGVLRLSYASITVFFILSLYTVCTSLLTYVCTVSGIFC